LRSGICNAGNGRTRRKRPPTSMSLTSLVC